MVWDSDHDVKEYRPKKQSREMAIPFPKNAVSEAARRDAGVEDRAGGVMMTTSEILDFSEGSDSYI